MAINTFGTLKTAILNHLHRPNLSTVVGDFVAIAETQLARDVRVQAMETTATGTLSATTLALPTGFLEANRVVVANDVLRYLTPEQFSDVRDFNHKQYTVVGTNFVFQTASGDYTIEYYKRFDAFSDDADSNQLLIDYPDVYLYASLGAAASYTMADRTRWDVLYQRTLSSLRVAEQRKRFSGRLSVRPDCMVV